MADSPCPHLPPDLTEPPITATGCETCLERGKRDWVHLRYCLTCGRVGCCDDSPGKHAAAHFRLTGHPVLRSYEPDEEWYWCSLDQDAFLVDGAPDAASYPG